jgi:hypothetical protein
VNSSPVNWSECHAQGNAVHKYTYTMKFVVSDVSDIWNIVRKKYMCSDEISTAFVSKFCQMWASTNWHEQHNFCFQRKFTTLKILSHYNIKW